MVDFSELTDLNNLKAAAAEMLATLMLLFLGAGTVVVVTEGMGIDPTTDATGLIAIAVAFGISIMVLVAATARVSGGHINPAVTVGAMIMKRIGVVKGAMYIVAQLVGAVIGVLLVAAVIPGAIDGALGANAIAPGIDQGRAFLAEIVLTFALVFVIFTVGLVPPKATVIAPLIIGLTVLVCHLFGVSISGSSINPARSFGPALMTGEWANHWVYWAGPLLGGGLAAITATCIFGGKGEAESGD